MAAIHVPSRGYFAIVACTLLVQNTEGIVDDSKLSVALKMMEDSACDWTIHESYMSTLIEASRNSGKASMRQNKTAPHTCADIKRDDPEARDGEYWLFPKAPQFHGGRVKIYCLFNTTQQLEYLTLPNKNFGVYPKYRNQLCRKEILLSKETIIHAGETDFFKIRINPTDMTVVTNDTTCTSSTIKKLHIKMVYGMAIDCYAPFPCGPKGIFHINMQGTGTNFRPDHLTWQKHGHLAHDPVILKWKSGSIVDVRCGGFCGWCKPREPLILYPSDL